jgi:hypothetical protein
VFEVCWGNCLGINCLVAICRKLLLLVVLVSALVHMHIGDLLRLLLPLIA